MAYHRKTCECCKRRLEPEEDYWCATCRNTITSTYKSARLEIGMWMAMLPSDASDEAKVKHLLAFLDRKLGGNRTAA